MFARRLKPALALEPEPCLWSTEVGAIGHLRQAGLLRGVFLRRGCSAFTRLSFTRCLGPALPRVRLQLVLQCLDPATYFPGGTFHQTP